MRRLPKTLPGAWRPGWNGGADRRLSVAGDIFAAWGAPRRVFRRRAGAAPREDRALVVLMAACLLIFVAQWPRLSRQAFETGADLQPLIGGALFGLLFLAPLALYAIGTLTHLLARLLGGGASAYAARFALFWALLAATPLWLFWGLIAGFIGPGAAMSAVGLVAFGLFLWLWAMNFYEAEWG